MKAALFHKFDGPIAIEDVPDPECPDDGVVVEVRACGVCRSDYHTWKHGEAGVPLPHILGHELAGVVVEAGLLSGFEIGARVTVPFILSCGHCGDCASGRSTICETQTVLGYSVWGAFAQYVAVPNAPFNLVAMPDEVDFVQAAGMGCRVTTAYRGLTERGQLAPGEWLCVHGCGGIGLSAIMIARAIGAFIIAVDVNPEALVLAERFGASVCLNAAELGPEALIAAIYDASGGGAHVSIDALGITQTFHNSLHSLRKAGRHIQIGYPIGAHSNPSIPLLDIVYAKQISVLGTRGMGAHGFQGIFEMALAGRLDLDALVSKRITLQDVGSALASMGGFQGAGVTVVDRFDTET